MDPIGAILALARPQGVAATEPSSQAETPAPAPPEGRPLDPLGDLIRTARPGRSTDLILRTQDKRAEGTNTIREFRRGFMSFGDVTQGEFLGGGKVVSTRQADEARRRFEADQATDEDIDTLATAQYQQETSQKVKRAAGTEPFYKRVLLEAGSLGKIVGEMVPAGKAVQLAGRGVQGIQAARAARAGVVPQIPGLTPGALLPVPANAAALARSPVASVARDAVSKLPITALTPSMWVPMMQQNNIANRREANDLKGLPTAYGFGLANMVVLGRLGRNLEGVSGVVKPFVKGTGGVLEMNAVEAAAGLADKFILEKAYQVKPTGEHRYGTIASWLKAYKDNDRDKAVEGLRDTTAQMLTFSAFAAMHGKEAQATGLAKLYADSFAKMRDGGMPKQAAAARLKEVHDLFERRLESDPFATRGELKDVANMVPHDLRDYARHIADVFVPEPAPAPPAPQQPPVPQTPAPVAQPQPAATVAAPPAATSAAPPMRNRLPSTASWAVQPTEAAQPVPATPRTPAERVAAIEPELREVERQLNAITPQAIKARVEQGKSASEKAARKELGLTELEARQKELVRRVEDARSLVATEQAAAKLPPEKIAEQITLLEGVLKNTKPVAGESAAKAATKERTRALAAEQIDILKAAQSKVATVATETAPPSEVEATDSKAPGEPAIEQTPDTAASVQPEAVRPVGETPEAKADVLATVAARLGMTRAWVEANPKSQPVRMATAEATPDAPLTTIASPEHRAVSARAVGDGVVMEFDIRNMGGLTKKLGSTEASGKLADQFAEIVREELNKAGADARLHRATNNPLEDNYVVVTKQLDAPKIKAAMDAADARIQELASTAGVADLPHTKEGGKAGTGVQYGTAAFKGGDASKAFHEASEASKVAPEPVATVATPKVTTDVVVKNDRGRKVKTNDPAVAAAVTAYAADPPQAARNAIEAALADLGMDPHAPPRRVTQSPREVYDAFLARYAELAKIDPAAAKFLEPVLEASGARKFAAEGDVIPFDGSLHASDSPLKTGENVRVTRPGWERPESTTDMAGKEVTRMYAPEWGKARVEPVATVATPEARTADPDFEALRNEMTESSRDSMYRNPKEYTDNFIKNLEFQKRAFAARQKGMPKREYQITLDAFDKKIADAKKIASELNAEPVTDKTMAKEQAQEIWNTYTEAEKKVQRAEFAKLGVDVDATPADRVKQSGFDIAAFKADVATVASEGKFPRGEYARVLELKADGMGYRQIAKETGLSFPTAKRLGDAATKILAERFPDKYGEFKVADDLFRKLTPEEKGDLSARKEALNERGEAIFALDPTGVGFAAEALGRLWRNLFGPPRGVTPGRSALSRLWSRVTGDMPESVREAWQDRVKRQVAAEIFDVQSAEKDLYATLAKSGTPYESLTPDRLAKLKAVLTHGREARIPDSPEYIEGREQARAGESPEVLEVLDRMRSHVDRLTDTLIRIGAVDGPLVATLEANRGVYLNRQYEAFRDPEHGEKVPEEIKNRYRAWFVDEYQKANKGVSPPDSLVEGEMMKALYDATAAENPISVIHSAKLGAKDLSIFFERKDIPEPLRALLGEVQNPVADYANTVSKMAHVIANHAFLTRVAAEGRGRFLFDQPTGSHFSLIAEPGNAAMKPLSGLHTTPEIKRAFEEQFKAENLSPALQAYMKLLAGAKMSTVVLSHTGQERNFLSNVGIAVRNGWWNLGKLPEAWSALRKDTPEARAEWRRLIELGIVGESVHYNDIQKTVEDAFGRTASGKEADIGGLVERTLKRGVDVAKKTYHYGDAFWRVNGFYIERAKFERAGLPRAEAETRAADVVSRISPTYSKILPGIQALRRAPFAPFFAFQSEIVRTTYENLKLGFEEYRDPNKVIKLSGAKRLAGTAAAIAMPLAAAAAMRNFWNVTSEQEDAARRLGPEYQKESQLLVVGKDAKGVPEFIDLSRVDPHAYLTDGFMAMVRSPDEKGLEAAFKEFTKPFFAEELLMRPFFDAARNRKEPGGEVYNPQDERRSQVATVATSVAKPFVPGGFDPLNRAYKSLAGVPDPKTGVVPNVPQTLQEQVTGQRVYGRDPERAILGKARGFEKAVADANRMTRELINSKGAITPAQMQEAAAKTAAARARLFAEMKKDMDAAETLGVPRAKVVTLLREAGVSAGDIAALLAGRVPPHLPETKPGDAEASRRAVEVRRGNVNPAAGSPSGGLPALPFGPR